MVPFVGVATTPAAVLRSREAVKEALDRPPPPADFKPISALLAALLASCGEPSRAVVRPDGGTTVDVAADVPSERVGAAGAGDCAQDNGGCSVYAVCVPEGSGRRRCECAPGLRVQADQRSCEGLLLVSAARNGSAGGAFVGPRLAARGRYVVFVSQAPDLPYDRAVPATAPAPMRCYLRDVVAGRTVLLSADANGALPTTASGCIAPQVSADGRLVSFLHIDAITPADPPTHPVHNVYVRSVSADLAVGAPRRLHLDGMGPLDRESQALHMSRDGRRFALETRSSLLPSDGESFPQFDIYVYTEGATPPVAIASVDVDGRIPFAGGPCGGNVRPGAFSGDGDSIGFDSPRRYDSGDNDDVLDPHVRSLTARATELLTPRRGTRRRAACATMGSGVALSYDARYALIFSDNERFDATLTAGNPDVFLVDRAAPAGDPSRVVRLHVDPMPDVGGQFNEGLAISDDGRLAVVSSRRRLDLPAGAALRPSPDLYLLDLSDPSQPLRNARILDVDARGEPSDPGRVLFEPTLAADGSAVAFVARTPLLPADTNDESDVYLRVFR